MLQMLWFVETAGILISILNHYAIIDQFQDHPIWVELSTLAKGKIPYKYDANEDSLLFRADGDPAMCKKMTKSRKLVLPP